MTYITKIFSFAKKTCPLIERKRIKGRRVAIPFCFFDKQKGGPELMGKLESDFQGKLKKKIKKRFPGCVVTKLDANDIQGIPDLLILYEDKWSILEVKKSANAPKQPNQDYYVDKFNKMSFSSFIFPENEEEVLSELEKRFNR